MYDGIVSTPFIWNYFGQIYSMNFYSGFIGATMENDYIKPVIFWAVGS